MWEDNQYEYLTTPKETPMSETKEELKACPFCGGEARILLSYRWYGLCDTCHTSSGYRASKAEAITAWNTREEKPNLTLQKAIDKITTLQSQLQASQKLNDELIKNGDRLTKQLMKDADDANKRCEEYTKELIKRDYKISAKQDRIKNLEEALGGLCPEVLAFAKTMQNKLDKNKHKACNVMNPDGKGRGWEHCEPFWLTSRIEDELAELKEILTDHLLEPGKFPAREVQLECADVGNFAMMIHDNTTKQALKGT